MSKDVGRDYSDSDNIYSDTTVHYSPEKESSIAGATRSKKLTKKRRLLQKSHRKGSSEHFELLTTVTKKEYKRKSRDLKRTVLNYSPLGGKSADRNGSGVVPCPGTSLPDIVAGMGNLSSKMVPSKERGVTGPNTRAIRRRDEPQDEDLLANREDSSEDDTTSDSEDDESACRTVDCVVRENREVSSSSTDGVPVYESVDEIGNGTFEDELVSGLSFSVPAGDDFNLTANVSEPSVESLSDSSYATESQDVNRRCDRSSVCVPRHDISVGEDRVKADSVAPLHNTAARLAYQQVFTNDVIANLTCSCGELCVHLPTVENNSSGSTCVQSTIFAEVEGRGSSSDVSVQGVSATRGRSVSNSPVLLIDTNKDVRLNSSYVKHKILKSVEDLSCRTASEAESSEGMFYSAQSSPPNRQPLLVKDNDPSSEDQIAQSSQEIIPAVDPIEQSVFGSASSSGDYQSNAEKTTEDPTENKSIDLALSDEQSDILEVEDTRQIESSVPASSGEDQPSVDPVGKVVDLPSHPASCEDNKSKTSQVEKSTEANVQKASTTNPDANPRPILCRPLQRLRKATELRAGKNLSVAANNETCSTLPVVGVQEAQLLTATDDESCLKEGQLLTATNDTCREDSQLLTAMNDICLEVTVETSVVEERDVLLGNAEPVNVDDEPTEMLDLENPMVMIPSPSGEPTPRSKRADCLTRRRLTWCGESEGEEEGDNAAEAGPVTRTLRRKRPSLLKTLSRRKKRDATRRQVNDGPDSVTRESARESNDEAVSPVSEEHPTSDVTLQLPPRRKSGPKCWKESDKRRRLRAHPSPVVEDGREQGVEAKSSLTSKTCPESPSVILPASSQDCGTSTADLLRLIGDAVCSECYVKCAAITPQQVIAANEVGVPIEPSESVEIDHTTERREIEISRDAARRPSMSDNWCQTEPEGMPVQARDIKLERIIDFVDLCSSDNSDDGGDDESRKRLRGSRPGADSSDVQTRDSRKGTGITAVGMQKVLRDESTRCKAKDVTKNARRARTVSVTIDDEHSSNRNATKRATETGARSEEANEMYPSKQSRKRLANLRGMDDEIRKLVAVQSPSGLQGETEKSKHVQVIEGRRRSPRRKFVGEEPSETEPRGSNVDFNADSLEFSPPRHVMRKPTAKQTRSHGNSNTEENRSSHDEQGGTEKGRRVVKCVRYPDTLEFSPPLRAHNTSRIGLSKPGGKHFRKSGNEKESLGTADGENVARERVKTARAAAERGGGDRAAAGSIPPSGDRGTTVRTDRVERGERRQMSSSIDGQCGSTDGERPPSGTQRLKLLADKRRVASQDTASKRATKTAITAAECVGGDRAAAGATPPGDEQGTAVRTERVKRNERLRGSSSRDGETDGERPPSGTQRLKLLADKSRVASQEKASKRAANDGCRQKDRNETDLRRGRAEEKKMRQSRLDLHLTASKRSTNRGVTPIASTSTARTSSWTVISASDDSDVIEDSQSPVLKRGKLNNVTLPRPRSHEAETSEEERDEHSSPGAARERSRSPLARSANVAPTPARRVHLPEASLARYSEREQRALVAYIELNGGYGLLKGRAFWQQMEQDKVCPGRSWASLKEHFMKSILPRIQVYASDRDATKRFLKQFKVNLAKRGLDASIAWTGGPKGLRYTQAEDEAIIEYVSHCRRFMEAKGNKLWKTMERRKIVTGRSWMSLKERYRRYICNNFNKYETPPDLANKMRRYGRVSVAS